MRTIVIRMFFVKRNVVTFYCNFLSLLCFGKKKQSVHMAR